MIPKGKYRHFKGAGLWIRPLDMFAETIERDGKTIKRFSFVG